MKAYIISVIGAVFLLDIAAAIIPSGKTGKTVCGVIRLCGALIMLLPIANVINNARYTFEGKNLPTTDVSYIDKSLAMQIENYISDNYKIECDVKKQGYILTVYEDKSAFPAGFEEDIKMAFDKNFTVIYEY